MTMGVKQFGLTILLIIALGIKPANSQQLLDYIVAVVDNNVILYSDVMEGVKLLRVQSPEEEEADIMEKILTGIIDTRIIIASAHRDSVLIPVDQIDSAVRQITDQYREQFGSQEALEKLVAKSGMSMRDWHRLLRQQKEDEYLQRKLEEERFGEIRVIGLEVAQFYETYRDSLPIKPVQIVVSHIMMTIHPDKERESKLLERADEIQRRLDAGADFVELAQRFSEDLNSAKLGGDLGFFARGTLMASFEEVAFELGPGEISDIVRTDVGFHIIKLEERDGEKIRVRHILIQVPQLPEDEDRTMETLEFLRGRILSGDESFEEAARKYSEDIDSSEEGGYLGEFYLDQVLPQYQMVLDTLTVGSVSPPIKVADQNSATFHLMMLTKRVGGEKLTLEDDFQQLTNLAKQNKWKEVRRRWLADLRQDVHIDNRGFDPDP
ncbi:MAG: peptidylprolyl isomerase [Gemmatimonadota bacterium]|nr:peptidylprolyl isomerase [Gemmatimonadota bacterium]